MRGNELLAVEAASKIAEKTGQHGTEEGDEIKGSEEGTFWGLIHGTSKQAVSRDLSLWNPPRCAQSHEATNGLCARDTEAVSKTSQSDTWSGDHSDR